MKLRQIQFAAAVARTASFSAAADICNVTQPTLSSAVRLLELELGANLFDRTTRKVQLTAFGRHMVPYLESVLSARNEAQAAAKAFHDVDRRLLRIGVSPLADARLISMVAEPFLRLHPKWEVFFKECLLDDLSDRLASDTIDVAVLPKASVPDAVQHQPFYREQMHYLPMNGISNDAGAPLRVAEVPDDPVIMTNGGCGLNQSLKAVLDSEGVSPPAYPGHAISYSVIQDWVWLGLGAAILPRSKLTDQVGTAKPLVLTNGTPAEFEFCWCWRKEALEKPQVAAFLEFSEGKGLHLTENRDISHAV